MIFHRDNMHFVMYTTDGRLLKRGDILGYSGERPLVFDGPGRLSRLGWHKVIINGTEYHRQGYNIEEQQLFGIDTTEGATTNE
jgi:hypothetical protein